MSSSAPPPSPVKSSSEAHAHSVELMAAAGGLLDQLAVAKDVDTRVELQAELVQRADDPSRYRKSTDPETVLYLEGLKRLAPQIRSRGSLLSPKGWLHYERGLLAIWLRERSAHRNVMHANAKIRELLPSIDAQEIRHAMANVAESHLELPSIPRYAALVDLAAGGPFPLAEPPLSSKGRIEALTYWLMIECPLSDPKSRQRLAVGRIKQVDRPARDELDRALLKLTRGGDRAAAIPALVEILALEDERPIKRAILRARKAHQVSRPEISPLL